MASRAERKEQACADRDAAEAAAARAATRRTNLIRLGLIAAGAGVAVGAAQQSRLWPFADVFYSRQGEENSGYVTSDFLKQIAGATPGLNAPRALAFATTQAATNYVNANETLATGLKSTSTPSFYIRRG